MTKPSPPEQLKFEEALAELEGIVAELERSEIDLDTSIARFERGVALARRCEDRLDEAEKKLAVLIERGGRILELDMKTGETLSEQEPVGDDDEPDAATEPEAAAEPEAEPEPEPEAAGPGQQSLLGGTDDDIPF